MGLNFTQEVLNPGSFGGKDNYYQSGLGARAFGKIFQTGTSCDCFFSPSPQRLWLQHWDGYQVQ